MLNLRVAVFLLSMVLTEFCLAAETKLTVPLTYDLLGKVLVKQLYTHADETARVWKEGKECSFLDLDHPKISSENQELILDNHVHARIGINLAGKCIPAIEWRGKIQTFQKASLEAKNRVLRFPISHVLALDDNNQTLNIKELQGLIDQAVQAKLGNLKIDLNELEPDISKTLSAFMTEEDSTNLNNILKTLHFKQVIIQEHAIDLTLAFTAAKPTKLQQEAAFSDEELQAWQVVWHKLEQNLQQGLAKAKQNADTEAALASILESAGAAFTEGLSATDLTDDPVRDYLHASWDDLAPAIRTAAQQLSGTEGLQVLTLVSATDLLYQLDTITSPFGLNLSANGLRKTVRAYLAHQH